jgi:acetyltransferase-like isoleucine patch superfamily enzyme
VGQNVAVERNVRLLRHPNNIRLSDKVMLKEGVRLCPAQPNAFISIGENTTVGYHTFLFASAGITIGADCLVAPFCYLVDANHGMARGELIREQMMEVSPIRVGDDVWIGTRAVIMPGVSIARGAVVAAGSIVLDDVPEYAIVAGAPARIKRYRD